MIFSKISKNGCGAAKLFFALAVWLLPQTVFAETLAYFATSFSVGGRFLDLLEAKATYL